MAYFVELDKLFVRIWYDEITEILIDKNIITKEYDVIIRYDKKENLIIGTRYKRIKSAMKYAREILTKTASDLIYMPEDPKLSDEIKDLKDTIKYLPVIGDYYKESKVSFEANIDSGIGEGYKEAKESFEDNCSKM